MTAGYESREAREQYLFFHYGQPREYLPYPNGPHDAIGYPWRAVEALLHPELLPASARALDLGCAVGRSSFELSRSCRHVVGIDLSRSFIRAAQTMKRNQGMTFAYTVEGATRRTTRLRLPRGVHPDRVVFRVGDAQALPSRLGRFDVALLLNLIDRLPDPAVALQRLIDDHLNPGAQLLMASPYTWLAEYTPPSRQLGGTPACSTFDALRDILAPRFRLLKRVQLPFLIREHARKYQWSMAEGTAWRMR